MINKRYFILFSLLLGTSHLGVAQFAESRIYKNFLIEDTTKSHQIIADIEITPYSYLGIEYAYHINNNWSIGLRNATATFLSMHAITLNKRVVFNRLHLTTSRRIFKTLRGELRLGVWHTHLEDTGWYKPKYDLQIGLRITLWRYLVLRFGDTILSYDTSFGGNIYHFWRPYGSIGFTYNF